MNAPIVPAPFLSDTATQLVVADSFSVTIGEGSNPSQAFFSYQLMNAIGTPLTSGQAIMSPIQWADWAAGGSDVQYVLSCVAAYLGLTLVTS